MKRFVQNELLVVVFVGICLLSVFFFPLGVFGAESSAVDDSPFDVEMVETQDSESVTVDKTLQTETGQTEVVVWLSESDNFEQVATRSDALSIENQFSLIDAAVVTVDLAQVDVAQVATVAGVEAIHANFDVEIGDVTRSATAPVSAIGAGRTAGSELSPQQFSSAQTANFESVSATYGLEQIGAPTAWDEYDTRGESTRVAVLDTGIAVDHDDLELYSDDPDDPTYPGGWAEISSSGEPIADSEPHDTSDHGTHVSGTVAGGDASGEHIGVAPETELMHGLVLPSGSGSFSRIVGGIEWAVANDADVITMSLGSDGYSSWFIDPIRAAEDAGVTVTASIGNSGEGTSSTPGNEYDSIGVGASNQWDGIGQYSGGELIDTASAWGSSAPDDWPDEYIVPSVTAPGSLVTSTVPDNGYSSFSGTSMAAPHVAGAVALIQSATDQSHSPTEIETALQETAWKPDDWDASDAEDSLDGADTRFGYGVIDVPAAIEFLDSDDSDKPAEFDVSILDTTEPLEGAAIEVSFAVTNGGDETGTQTLSLSTVPELGETTTELTLSAGETTTETLSLATEFGDAGSYTATVASDDDESNTDLTVLADSSFELDILSATDSVAGDDIEIDVGVENTGDVEATQTVALSTAPDIGADSIDVTLDGEESTVKTLSVATDSDDVGTYAVTVESNDDSESTELDVLEPATFDVSVLSTTDPVAGDDIEVEFEVENTGDIEDTQTLELDVGALWNDETDVTLGGGETTEETLTVETAAGDAGEYTATVTSEDDSSETSVELLEPANFAVEIRSVTEPVAGEDIEIEVDIENQGDVEATQTLVLTTDPAIGTDETELTLSGGESTTETLSVATDSEDSGEFTATVASDDDSDGAEISVLEPAAFDIHSVATNEPVAGDDVVVTTELTNPGDVAGTETVTISVGLLGEESTEQTLEAGETAELSIAVGTESDDAGEYDVTVTTESDEETTGVTVLSEAVFSVAILETNEPVAGDDIDVEVAVENTGDVEATQTLSLSSEFGETSREVTLSGGETTVEMLSIATESGDSGTTTVTTETGDADDSATVTVLEPATFAVELIETTEPVVGEELAVTAELTNAGDVGGTETVTLSVDALGEESTELSLDAGETTEKTLALETEPGDAGEYAAELSTADETVSTDVTVLEPAAFEVAITGMNAPVVAGEELTVTAEITNTGDVTGTETITASADGLGSEQIERSLAGAETLTETVSLPTQADDAGTYDVTVATETDEDTAEATVLAEGAFVVSILETNEPVVGEQLEVEFEVENTGDVAARQTLSLSSAFGDDSAVVSLDGGETTVETLAVETDSGDAGTTTVTIASDDDEATTTVTVSEPATFEVEHIETNEPVAGEDMLVTAEITNTGDVSGTETVTLSVDGVGEETTEVSLAAGETTTQALAVETEDGDSGTYDVTVTTEDSEAHTVVTVLEPAAFTVDIVETTTPIVGTDLAVTAEITNIGDVSGTETVTLAVDGIGTDETELSLDGGESTEQTLSIETESDDGGEYTATVETEHDSEETTVDVLESAAFDVDIMETNAPVVAGEELTVSAEITNAGDVSGTETVTLSVDGLGENNTVVALDGGETTTETFSVETESGDAGEYTATVETADDTDSAELTVAESGSAEFRIQDVETNAPLGSGEELAVSVTLRNVGDSAGEQSLTAAVVDLSETATTVSLESNQTRTVTVGLDTEDAGAGSHELVVETADDMQAEQVVFRPPRFPGAGAAPQDLTGDGLYEDINGDGSFGIVDVQILFQNLSNPTVQENAEFYDFAGTDSDRVSIFDIVALFNRL